MGRESGVPQKLGHHALLFPRGPGKINDSSAIYVWPPTCLVFPTGPWQSVEEEREDHEERCVETLLLGSHAAFGAGGIFVFRRRGIWADVGTVQTPEPNSSVQGGCAGTEFPT